MIRAYIEEAEIAGLADEIFEDLRPRMEAVAKEGAEMLANEMRRLLSRRAGGGRMYGGSRHVAFNIRASELGGRVFSRKGRTIRRGVSFMANAGELHQAAAEGEPPTRLTGELQASITVRPPKWTQREVRVPVGTPLKWAGRMEYGGRDSKGRRLPPHPFYRPAAATVQPRFDKLVEERL